MNITTKNIAKDGLPQGFVYIDELLENCIIDAKYWGTDNFLGRPVAGYERPLVVMSEQAALCCVKAAELLHAAGYIIKIYDAFRPKRAVKDIVRWTSDAEDIRRKPIHYPNVNKADFIKFGYVAETSEHSRGNAVDLTIVDAKTYHELDMGTIFDFMDYRSHVVTEGLTDLQEANRQILRHAMTACGFKTYNYEWWHFDLAVGLDTDTYFDFPIK